MNPKKVDLLNIFLIFISLIIAIKIPFELFLFSFAILGPLHYLTEINWLHEKNYFVLANKNWSIVLIILVILLSLYPIVQFSNIAINQVIEDIIKRISQKTNAILLIGFLFAIGLIYFKKAEKLVLTLFFAVLITFLLLIYFPTVSFLIGIFLPTLIHVYIFTLFFIFYGALKSKSKYGFSLSIILLMVPAVISYIPIDPVNYKPTEETLNSFVSSNMTSVSELVAKTLNKLEGEKFNALSEIGIRIQIFISFAYTYHYLNWFSKTSIIGWRKAISKKRAFLILFIWAVSIGIYIYDFQTGYIALFLLSFLHVFLEFPLNVITIKEMLLLTKRNRT